MANYFSDAPELEFHLHHPLMKRIVELKERNFEDKDKYDDAPVDYEDAIENYKQLLEITGDITANVIEPNSESVDEEGPHLVDGRMVYASKTFENLDATRKAGLWGISMPRRYGGLTLPITPYSMASEMMATADAGFQNIWSLQDCIETLYEFGDEEQRKKYIPRVCQGETMSMDLTEPDAGSDAQSHLLGERWLLAYQWRKTLHHQRRLRHSPRSGALRRGHERWSRTVDVYLRQASRRRYRTTY